MDMLTNLSVPQLGANKATLTLSAFLLCATLSTNLVAQTGLVIFEENFANHTDMNNNGTITINDSPRWSAVDPDFSAPIVVQAGNGSGGAGGGLDDPMVANGQIPTDTSGSLHAIGRFWAEISADGPNVPAPVPFSLEAVGYGTSGARQSHADQVGLSSSTDYNTAVSWSTQIDGCSGYNPGGDGGWALVVPTFINGNWNNQIVDGCSGNQFKDRAVLLEIIITPRRGANPPTARGRVTDLTDSENVYEVTSQLPDELFAKEEDGGRKLDMAFVQVDYRRWSAGQNGAEFDDIRVLRGSVSNFLTELAALVFSLNLANGIENSLDAKLSSALQALDDANDNNDGAAIGSLTAFINAVEAQSGHQIEDPDNACILIEWANAALELLDSAPISTVCDAA